MRNAHLVVAYHKDRNADDHLSGMPEVYRDAIEIKHPSGYSIRNVIGFTLIHHTKDGNVPEQTEVSYEWRRKGVATAMYDESKKFTGKEVTPSTNQSHDAEYFWREYRRHLNRAEVKEAFSSISDLKLSGTFNSLGKLKISDKSSELLLNGEKIGEAVFGTHESGKNKYITLNRIEINKPFRKEGYGNMFMEQLVKTADKLGMRIVLSPTNEFGSSKARLTSWYKKFGFVMNSGRNKDWQVRETMIRRNEDDET